MEKENLGLPLALQAQFENCERLLDDWLLKIGLTRKEFFELGKKSHERTLPPSQQPGKRSALERRI